MMPSDKTESDLMNGVDRLNLYESDDQLIIALDFGTTFSGIAFAFTNSEKADVIPILDWPGLEGFKEPKVPTAICYGGGSQSGYSWGAQKHAKAPVQGIKLLLDPDQEVPFYIPGKNIAAEFRALGKPAVQVASDYISAIYKHAQTKIESKVPKEYLKLCQRKFVVSVPAVWSDKAKNATLTAAKNAGIYPVTLVKEPEAAALYTLHTLQDRALAVGDAFVLCDAGGGTVDLISYEITALEPKLELRELVAGKGGMAGSLGLNMRFTEAVKDLIGDDQFYHLRKTKAYEEAMKQFDKQIKTAFRGDADEDYYVNFPMAKLQDDPKNRLTSNCWNMKGKDIKRIFQPLISNIQQLVDDQINLVKVKRLSDNHPKAEHIKAIFLVGGFGSSEYLKKSLETAHPEIQVIQPHDAWSAIVRGAVLSQMPQSLSGAVITSTVATKHYGVETSTRYDALVDDRTLPRYECEFTGKEMIQKMMWYIERGEDLVREKKISFSFFRKLPERYHPSDLIFVDKLVECCQDKAPTYPSRGILTPNCELRADLQSVDRSHFREKVDQNGRKYWEVHYDLIIETDTALMRFYLEFEGEKMGSVEAKYE